MHDVPTRTSLISKVSGHPIAIQVLWRGHTTEWRVEMDAVLDSGVTIPMHVFRGLELASAANDLGTEVAAHFGVPLWFPSPTYPDKGYPGWLDRNGDRTCIDCHETLVLRVCPELPNDVCNPCRDKRNERQRLRDDTPLDARGVTVVLVSDDGTYCGYTDPAANDPVARFALHTLGRTNQAETTDEVIVEGMDLAGLEVELVAGARSALETFDKQPKLPRLPNEETHVFEGRTLTFLPVGFAGMFLHRALSELERCHEAMRDGLRYRLLFRHRLTSRMQHVLVLLRYRDHAATVTSLCEACRDDLDDMEVRDAIERLVALGHVTVDDNVVRLTVKGRYV